MPKLVLGRSFVLRSSMASKDNNSAVVLQLALEIPLLPTGN